jgi:hypothetical protein
MTDWNKLFKNSPARSFRAVLSDLAALTLKEEALPTISVSLSNGEKFTGTVINFEQGHQQDILVMKTIDRSRQDFAEQMLTYINGHDICALSLHLSSSNDSLVSVITAGKIKSPNVFSPLSKLNFQRFILDQEITFSSICTPGSKIEIAENIYNSLEDFADLKGFTVSILSVLQAIAKEPLGKEALQQKITLLKLSFAKDFSVRLDNKTLSIFISNNDLSSHSMSDEILRNGIEGVL